MCWDTRLNRLKPGAMNSSLVPHSGGKEPQHLNCLLSWIESGAAWIPRGKHTGWWRHELQLCSPSGMFWPKQPLEAASCRGSPPQLSLRGPCEDTCVPPLHAFTMAAWQAELLGSAPTEGACPPRRVKDPLRLNPGARQPAERGGARHLLGVCRACFAHP